MSAKIVELQGLRCVAIVSVLLFHIWPNVFCNGFLGVDIFFVLSGYIMALILLSSNTLKESFIKTTLTFYYRRIYRILPLYLLNILATMIFVPAFSFTYYYADLLEQVKTALTFSVNFSMLFTKNNYFTPGLTYNWFKHYWSLCVEMQFYAILPFIFYFSKKLPLSANLFVFWPSLIGSCVALIFYMLIKYGETGAFFTFTMVPARIYEFAGGFVAFHAQEFIELHFNDHKFLHKIKETLHSVITKNVLTVILFLITLFPIKLIDIYTLPAIVVITSASIAAIGKNKLKDEMRYSVLANNVFVCVGDASYSIYISHWMVVHLSKLIYSDDEYHRQILLLLCVIIGFVVNRCIEKPIVKARLKPEQCFPWLIIIYLVIGYVASTNNFTRSTSDITKDLFHNQSKLFWNATKREEIARLVHPDISAELGFYGWQELCKNKKREFNGTGSISVLLLGNSHAGCIKPGLELALKGLYSEIREFTVAGQTPFEGFKNGKRIPELKTAVQKNKPDVIFLIFKYMEDMDEPALGPEDENAKVRAMQEMIDFLSNNTKALLISGGHFEAFDFSSLKWAENVWQNGWTNNYAVKRKDIEAAHAVSTQRWKEIKCKNCIFINMLDAFCSEGWCSPLDKSRKIPLVFDANHVTKFGAYYLTTHLQKYFKNMYEFLKAAEK